MQTLEFCPDHQQHVAYERRNPSGLIFRLKIERVSTGPMVTAETFPERAVRITARE
jgi:hypothetical protein